MTNDEIEEYSERVRVAVGETLFRMSEDGDTLPIADETFLPTLFGVIRCIAALAAARRAEGGNLDIDGVANALGEHFSLTTRSLETVFLQMKEQEAKPAN